MARKILVADDNETNRLILHKILGNDYDIEEAENGEEALMFLHRHYKMLSAVILDLMMPEMDGYEVLHRMRDNIALAQIPVIVVTSSNDEESRVRALALGANDFVTKPYHPDIIRHCLRNNIALRETASIVNAIQKDKLTDMYNREVFFEKADKLIKSHVPGTYMMGCADIDNFKLVNERFGASEGDRILRHLGKALKTCMERVDGLCGRISADNFVVLYPNTPDAIEQVTVSHRLSFIPENLPTELFLSIGRCVVNDVTLPASALYDRAYIAKHSVKGRYDTHVALFDNSMLEELVKEQKIIAGMANAIAGKEFETWFQPQYNHSTGALVGAEALVRWRRKEDGALVSPVDFISVFEQNGFIYELDKYVWEDTCRHLRRWTDAGLQPLPVSVNISRYDIFRDNLTDVLCGLIRKYDIPVSLLRLEITESAFSKSTDRVVSIVRELMAFGFTVEIDDFGSGYSSLNTLKDVPAQILKLDMRFLEDSANSPRGGNILESIVRMAKWLGMSVIAEGVETQKQADFLKSIGCIYLQGYFYDRPMPTEDFEERLKTRRKEEKMTALETVDALDNNAFWDPNSIETLVFNSYIGVASIVEYHNGKTETLRVNDRLKEEFGEIRRGGVPVTEADFAACLDEKNRAVMTENLEKAIATRKESTCDLEITGLDDGRVLFLRSTVRQIARTADRFLLYCTFVNTTPQREAEQNALQLSDQFHAIMQHVNCGISAIALRGKSARLVFVNDRFYAMIGYTREQYHQTVKDFRLCVHPEDRDQFNRKVAICNQAGAEATIEYRVICANGQIAWLRTTITGAVLQGFDGPVQLAIHTDITAERAADEQLRYLSNIANGVPGGFARFEMRADGTLELLYVSRGYETLLGDTFENIKKRYRQDGVLAGVHPHDLKMMREVSERMNRGEAVANVRYRLHRCKNGYRWVMLSGQQEITSSGKTYYNVYYSDATETRRTEKRQTALLDNLPVGAALFHYDGTTLTVVHLNRHYWQMVGREAQPIMDITVLDAVHPADTALLQRELTAAIRDGRDLEVSLRIACGASGYRTFRITARIVPDKTGTYMIYAAYVPLSASELSFREMLPIVFSTVMNTTGKGFSFVKDREGRYLCASNSATRLIGLSNEREIIGRMDEELFDPETAARYLAQDRQVMETGEPLLDVEESLPSDNGPSRTGNLSKYPLRDANGTVIGIYGVDREITAEKNLAVELDLLTKSIPGGLAAFFFAPGEIKTIYFNDGFFRFSGYTREEYTALTEKNPLALIYEEDRTLVLDAIDALHRGSQTRRGCYYRCHTKDGDTRWFSMIGTLVEDHGESFVVNLVQHDITMTRNADEKLRMSEEESRLAIRHSDAVVCRYDCLKKDIQMLSENAVLSGLPEHMENVPEEPVRQGMVSADTADAYHALFAKILSGENEGTAQYLWKCEGQWRRIEAYFSTVFSDDGKPVSAVISYRDVTEECEKEAIYLRWQQSLQERPAESYTLYTCNLSKDTSYDTVEGGLLQITFHEGVASFDAYTQDYATHYVCTEDRENYQETLKAARLIRNFRMGKRVEVFDYREIVGEGQVRWLRRTVETVEYPHSADILAYVMFEDIDTVKREELETKLLSETDSLTGVLNRKAFADRMNAWITAHEDGSRCALLMLDLDGFKQVNDSFGHEVGDQVLIGVTEKLGHILRETDLIGRLGGDEFIVAMCEVPNRAVIGKKAAQICAVLRQSFSLGVQVSASVGIAVTPEDGTDFEALYHKADMALYQVKATGKDNYAFYAANMRTEAPHTPVDAPADTAVVADTRRRMLVVEDDEVTRDILVNLFDKTYTVDSVKNGAEALLYLGRYGFSISVVLLDLLMPETDGFTVLQQMRGNPKLAAVPVVVVSSMDEPEVGIRAIRAGASDFVTKPIDADLLSLRVDAVVGNAENERLRVENRRLTRQNEEAGCYRSLLGSENVAITEYDRKTDSYRYEQTMTTYLSGTFNDRPLPAILTEDGVADVATVGQLCEAMQVLLADEKETAAALLLPFTVPSGESHLFTVKLVKRLDGMAFGRCLVLAFTDTAL